jgi:hypothetical protein
MSLATVRRPPQHKLQYLLLFTKLPVGVTPTFKVPTINAPPAELKLWHVFIRKSRALPPPNVTGGVNLIAIRRYQPRLNSLANSLNKTRRHI